MKEAPIVSVLMTAYNRESIIAQAIESVLASSLKDFELIIVDDCSKDKTVSVAKQFEQSDTRVKVYQNELNLGDYPNRNKAASLATGKYIKYSDSDDIMYPHCLEVMVNCMEKFSEAGYGLSAIGDNTKPYPVCLSPKEAYIENFIEGKGHFNRAPGSSIIKKVAFESVKGFSGLRQVGDFEFWMKIGCYFPLVKMPVDLYWSRLHDSSESSANSEAQKQKMRIEVIKKIFSEEEVPLNEKEKRLVVSNFSGNGIRKKLGKIKAILGR